MKFKAGETVIFVGVGGYSTEEDFHFLDQPCVVVIAEPVLTLPYYVRFSNGYCSHMREDELRKRSWNSKVMKAIRGDND